MDTDIILVLVGSSQRNRALRARRWEIKNLADLLPSASSAAALLQSCRDSCSFLLVVYVQLWFIRLQFGTLIAALNKLKSFLCSFFIFSPHQHICSTCQSYLFSSCYILNRDAFVQPTLRTCSYHATIFSITLNYFSCLCRIIKRTNSRFCLVPASVCKKQRWRHREGYAHLLTVECLIQILG